jgi:hypothetical protein
VKLDRVSLALVTLQESGRVTPATIQKVLPNATADEVKAIARALGDRFDPGEGPAYSEVLGGPPKGPAPTLKGRSALSVRIDNAQSNNAQAHKRSWWVGAPAQPQVTFAGAPEPAKVGSETFTPHEVEELLGALN